MKAKRLNEDKKKKMCREVMKAITCEGGRFVEYNGTNYVELLDDVALPIIFKRLIPGRLKKPLYLIRTITTKTEIEPAPTQHNNNKKSTTNNNVTTTNNTDGGPASSTRSKNRSSYDVRPFAGLGLSCKCQFR